MGIFGQKFRKKSATPNEPGKPKGKSFELIARNLDQLNEKGMTTAILTGFATSILALLDSHSGDEEPLKSDVGAVFCEQYRPLSRSQAVGKVPTKKEIIKHIQHIQDKLAITSEFSLAASVYVTRLSQVIPFTPTTWRRIVILAFVLSLKFFEDARFFNEDCVRYLDFDLLTVRDVTVMERRGLRLLKWELFVTDHESKGQLEKFFQDCH